jgi:hypothetical protein
MIPERGKRGIRKKTWVKAVILSPRAFKKALNGFQGGKKEEESERYNRLESLWSIGQSS